MDLKRIQNEIGLTSYHWKLFALAGSGWAFDNLFFQMMAIILPQLQKEFSLSGFSVGLPSFSMYLGAMLGNLVFGYLSDRYGRKRCFLATLLVSSLATFMIAISLSLEMVLVASFLLGIGVGGGLPVDGNIFIESIPPAKESLLALLSCFWPVGQVVAAAFALGIMPIWSCSGAENNKCDLADNQSWRIFCVVLGSLSFVGFLFRIFSVVEESPAYLYSQGKLKETFETLERMSGQITLDMTLDEFLQMHNEEEEGEREEDEDENTARDCQTLPSHAAMDDATEETILIPQPQPKDDSSSRISFTALFKGPYLKTTVVMLLVWCFLGLGFNIFHGFLPEFLQNHNNGSTHPRSIVDTYRFYLITSLCGVPGSFVAMVASDLQWIGSKPTLIISTLSTSLCLVLFALLTDDAGQLTASCMEAFSSTVMYGVLYFITPLTFPVYLRGKGFGLCSAVSRLFGSVAPLLAGFLLEFSTTLPLLFSAFFLLCACLLMGFITVAL